MITMTRLGQCLDDLKSKGLRLTIKHAIKYGWDCLFDRIYDRDFKIDASGWISSSELGYRKRGYYNYTPTAYRSFRKIMKEVSIVPGQDVFLDYGSGMGRVLIMAAQYPFRKVMGIELSHPLNEIAAENIQRTRSRLRCQNVEIVEADASKHVVPSDVTICYFYNPFSDDVLAQALDRLHESLLAAPRRITLIYLNPGGFEKEAMKRDWLVKRAEFKNYARHRYVIYTNNYQVEPSKPLQTAS
jgi:SAM-dependent methyltransferase